MTEDSDGNVLLSKQAADDLLGKLAYLEREVERWKNNSVLFAQTSREISDKLIQDVSNWRELATGLVNHLRGYVCQCNMSKCKCGYDDLMDMYDFLVEVQNPQTES